MGSEPFFVLAPYLIAALLLVWVATFFVKGEWKYSILIMAITISLASWSLLSDGLGNALERPLVIAGVFAFYFYPVFFGMYVLRFIWFLISSVEQSGSKSSES